jgi:hypothetical protein
MIIAEYGNTVLDAIGIDSTSSIHNPILQLLDPDWYVATTSRGIIYTILGINSLVAPDITVLKKLEDHITFGESEDADYISLLKLRKLNIDVLILSNYKHAGLLLRLLDHYGYNFVCKNIIIVNDSVKYRGKYFINDVCTLSSFVAVGESVRVLRTVINMVIADHQYGPKAADPILTIVSLLSDIRQTLNSVN